MQTSYVWNGSAGLGGFAEQFNDVCVTKFGISTIVGVVWKKWCPAYHAYIVDVPPTPN